MTDEMVDVVDENDNVIGKEWKNICHEKGILHRIAGIILFDSNGSVWLQTRAKNKVGTGNLDFSASGHIGSGDSYERGAYRELKEELGIKTDLKFIGKKSYKGRNESNHFLSVYTGNYDGVFNLQESEVESIKAYSLAEIKKMFKQNPEKIMSGLKEGLSYILK